jgi:hypothetical protein
MGEYTRALGEHITAALNDRPNQVTGQIVSSATEAGLTLYKIFVTHPGRSETHELFLPAPKAGSGVNFGELPIGAVVVLDVPQGQLGHSRLVSIQSLPSEVEASSRVTKDTSPFKARLMAPGKTWADAEG